MRFSLLPLLAAVALALAAPAANAMPQDLRSPDARDAEAQILQDRARLEAGNPLDRLHAQEKYYSSYGTAKPVQHTAPTADDSSPWPAIGIGLGVIAVVAGSVALTARTRRRTPRVAV